MKRTLLTSLAVLTVLVVGLALTGCSSGDSHEHGSAEQKTPEHQHSH
ncbi:MAG: hypothetical protein ACYC23_20210 [Limisphaerales bacterium]